MNLTINIPKEFEDHFRKDAFADSLERLKQDVHLIAGSYEKELIDMLINSFKCTANKMKIEDFMNRPVTCLRCRHYNITGKICNKGYIPDTETHDRVEQCNAFRYFA